MRYIGLDVGFGYTKAKDEAKTIVFPSVISPPVETSFKSWWQDPSDRLNHLNVTMDEKTCFVGNLAMHQGRFAYGTLDRIRTQTAEYRILFLTALSLLVQLPDEELSVVTGLPVDDYEDRIMIERNLSGQFRLTVAEREVSFKIRNLTVIPQPCGAFMDLLFNDTNGDINSELAQGLIGIIDIGFKTTDFVLMQFAEYAQKLSGSLKHGMSTIYQAAISQFSAAFPGNWDLRSVEEALSEGFISRLGERRAINYSVLENDFKGLSSEIVSWVRERWSDQKLDRMLCTGGGSLLMKPYLSMTFPRMIFMDDPQQANVRGFYKGARYYYG